MDLAGAFASITDSASTAAARQLAAEAAGAFGLDPTLASATPAAGPRPTAAPGTTANLNPADAQAGVQGLWAKYRTVILVAGAVVLALVLVGKRRLRKK